MIFKQGILIDEKIRYFAPTVAVCLFLIIPLIVLSILDNALLVCVIFLMLLSPAFIISQLIGAIYLEWFCIYQDRIEVRNIYGIRNVVYYKDVISVEELDISLGAYGWRKRFYIFNDGRKNNNSDVDFNSCYNSKKYNLRIYKTKKIEDYITNVLGLNIQKTKQKKQGQSFQ